MGYLIRYRTCAGAECDSFVFGPARTAPPAKSLISLEFFLGVRSHIKGAQNYCINEQVNCYTLLQ
jgi:hypothetical protein